MKDVADYIEEVEKSSLQDLDPAGYCWNSLDFIEWCKSMCDRGYTDRIENEDFSDLRFYFDHEAGRLVEAGTIDETIDYSNRKVDCDLMTVKRLISRLTKEEVDYVVEIAHEWFVIESERRGGEFHDFNCFVEFIGDGNWYLRNHQDTRWAAKHFKFARTHLSRAKALALKCIGYATVGFLENYYLEPCD